MYRPPRCRRPDSSGAFWAGASVDLDRDEVATRARGAAATAAGAPASRPVCGASRPDCECESASSGSCELDGGGRESAFLRSRRLLRGRPASFQAVNPPSTCTTFWKPLASSAAAEGPEPSTEPQITTTGVSRDVTAGRWVSDSRSNEVYIAAFSTGVAPGISPASVRAVALRTSTRRAPVFTRFAASVGVTSGASAPASSRLGVVSAICCSLLISGLLRGRRP